METSKFINEEMALMAATTTLIAVVKSGKYCNLSGSAKVGRFTLEVHLEIDELFTLPSGYLYSGVKEKTFSSPMIACPPFKIKTYYFEF